MKCYDESTLRAWLDDQPSLVAGADSASIGAHVAGCTNCQSVTADLQARASVASSAIGALRGAEPTSAEIETALAAVRRPGGATADVVAIAPRRRNLSRPIAAAAAAVVVLGIVGTPAGRTAAADFLAQFRSERIAVVEISPEDQEALYELAEIGHVSSHLDAFRPEPVESDSAASREVGFHVLVPDPDTIPAGLGGKPEIQISRAQELRFTLDRDRTLNWLAERNSPIGVPERYDGASIVVQVPAVVVQHWPAPDGTPGLVVGQSRQVAADTEGGVTLDEMRSFLLSLPGLSDNTKSQLEKLGDWRETLPLPLPKGQVTWRETEIAGAEGLMLGDNTGLGSAAIWQKDGFIYGVAVRGKADQVRDVAAGLR